ncbi:MAG: type II secretion system minor pseudopilin GspI [Gammaproteobacteria bacterium]|nr:type II secretion system minor pseudopilin GspI [Gammaproteobacteria bacterium]
MMTYKKISGFTLIEVLIALAIISIALTAIIKATSQNIRDTAYLQDKMIAHWVGLQVINEVRADVLKLSNSSLSNETEMLGKNWQWQASLADTPNPAIKKIDVSVSRKDEDKKLLTLSSYKYVALP